MKRITASVLAAVLFLLLAPPAFGSSREPSAQGTEIVPLGFAKDHGRVVEGFAIIHRRAPGGPTAFGAKGGSGGKPSGGGSLYTLIGKGVRWKVTEDYVVNTANGDGARSAQVASAIDAGMAAWQSQVAFDIFGSLTQTSGPLSADWAETDGRNELYFSQTELDAGTVAVTVIWGIFGGPMSGRQIVECDMVFNDALPESWGDATVQSGVWDVQDIATHELGHVAGLGDLYSTAAMQQTMYGYASPDETKKRTLESGDIAGIKVLYP